MCINIIEPNKPLLTLIVLHRRGTGMTKEICRNRLGAPILTTDQDAVIAHAVDLARKYPTATYTVSRVNAVMEI